MCGDETCARCADNLVVPCVSHIRQNSSLRSQINAERNTELAMFRWQIIILLAMFASVLGFSIQYRGNTRHPSRS